MELRVGVVVVVVVVGYSWLTGQIGIGHHFAFSLLPFLNHILPFP